jgi:2-dehydropantoate 2-reductase
MITKTVSILGAGAMGAVFASKFFELDRACISLTASGERYDRLASRGLIVNDRHYAIPVLTPDDTSPPSDLIIVALKHHHLKEAVHDLKHRVGENTTILSVMNGLDSEHIIGDVFGKDKVLYAISVGIDAQRNGHITNYTKLGTLFFGEADNTVQTERVTNIQALLRRAGINYETPIDMIRMMWWKFMINVGVNQASAVLAAPYGVFQASKHAQAIMESAMREVITIAKTAGVNLVEEDIKDWYKFLATLHREGKTSMLQDIEAGRETEVDIFAGKVVELGKTYAIPTPVNEILLHAIK